VNTYATLCNEADKMQQQNMPLAGGITPLPHPDGPLLWLARECRQCKQVFYVQVALLAETNMQ